MLEYNWIIAISICSLYLMLPCNGAVEETGKACTYFGAGRLSAPESSLINCSWYASNACCKRTEVTSVFGDMYPLFGATTGCSNRINYLMCYICSPEQHIWFNRKAVICEDYCHSLYDHCHTAKFNGSAIGERYGSGVEFCHGQRFEVVEGLDSCFKFDPTVFSHAYHINNNVISYVSLFALSLCGNLVM